MDMASGTSLAATPLFECFLNVPHPAASRASGPPMTVIPGPHTAADSRLLSQIQAFCFPEYESKSTAAFQSMHLNRFDLYAMQPKSFTSFTFTLQLQDGRRLYGHVRRSLPPHEKAPTRYDVGRRGERALVLLTQVAGAGQLYQAILKSLDSITSLQKALSPELRRIEEPEKNFLNSLYKEQQRMAVHYQQQSVEDRGKPLIAALSGLEMHQSALFAHQDVNRFIFPTCLLQTPFVGADENKAADYTTADSTSSLLPLLRCVGVAHALRILAALLSERRIILTSSSTTRLSTCSHAALAMLHCGLLHWQHLYIPVLPPHLWQYLAAPYPYLIGILQSATSKLDQTDGLGEVLIVNLDSNSMETRNIPQQVVAQRLPDLFSAADPNYYNDSSGISATGVGRRDKDMPPTASEFLAQDLLDILKTDKKTLYGETSTLINVGEQAGKAAKAIKSGFSKLKAKLKGQSSNVSDEIENDDANNDDGGGESKSVADDYIFTEGCHNEVGEQEARLAFTVFFLSLIGNMRWYLSAPGQGRLPELDRNRFLDQKRQAGDGQGSALWPLLQNFCQTQMFEEFAKARVEEIRLQVANSAPDAPLFAQCSQYHRQHNVDFSITSVRRVSRQVAQSNPGRLTGLLQTNARRMALSLTSTKQFEGDSGLAIAQLVEQCRECSSVLFDVMSVIWLRLRDTKGIKWKHGYQAMLILKNLLYHGPLAAVAEATDGLDKIRALKNYDHMRGGVAQDMKNSASYLYQLLVDRSALFTIRRLCAKKRRDMALPPGKRPKYEKMTRARLTDAVEQIHGAFHPLARATTVQMPAQTRQAPLVANPSAGPPQQVNKPETDLIGLGNPSGPARTPPSADADLFGFGGVSASPPTSSQPPLNPDLVGLFGTLGVSGSGSYEIEEKSSKDRSFDPKPTIAALPPAPVGAPANFPISPTSKPTFAVLPPQSIALTPAMGQTAPAGLAVSAAVRTGPAPGTQQYYGGAPQGYNGAFPPQAQPAQSFVPQPNFAVAASPPGHYPSQPPFQGQPQYAQQFKPQSPPPPQYQQQPPPPQYQQPPPPPPQYPQPPAAAPFYPQPMQYAQPPAGQAFAFAVQPQQPQRPTNPPVIKQFDPFAGSR